VAQDLSFWISCCAKVEKTVAIEARNIVVSTDPEAPYSILEQGPYVSGCVYRLDRHERKLLRQSKSGEAHGRPVYAVHRHIIAAQTMDKTG
jgi:hypothetical protein